MRELPIESGGAGTDNAPMNNAQNTPWATRTPGTVYTVPFADSLIIIDALRAHVRNQVEYIEALNSLMALGYKSVTPASYRNVVRECWNTWRIYNNLHN